LREIAVHALRVGRCFHPQAMTIQGGSWRPTAFPALSMVLIHPVEGPVLYDTGYDPAFFRAAAPFPERLYSLATPAEIPPGEELTPQLRRLGIAPDDMRHLVLSHFHADHIAGAHLFPHATIHCAKAGLTAARRGNRFSRVRHGILTALIPADIDARARYFEEGARVTLPADLAPFDSGVDLLGDGSMLAVELPGHCPGHWGLFVRDAAAGPHLMVGDAAWSCEAIEENRPPPALTTFLLGDTASTRNTLAKLNQLHRRNGDVRFTPCHCPRRAAEAEKTA